MVGGGPTSLRDGSPAFRFLDLFAGIGGIRLGLERAGGSCVYSVELDRHARRTYEANFGPCEWDDVRTLDAATIPLYDILAAGFPCQPFSLAGVSKKNSLGRPHGFADETSGDLFFQIARLAQAARPSVLFLENVKGLRRHDHGRTFSIIERTLDDLDYEITVTVLSARYWVPQLRERTFIVARDRRVFRGLKPFTFPAPPDVPRRTLADVLEAEVDPKYRLTPALWAYLQTYAAKHRAAGHGFGYRLYGPDDMAGTLSARYYKDGAEILIRTDGPTPRRLTPIEAARLMGFPAPFRGETPAELGSSPDRVGFALPLSDQQAWKQLGNSVVVPAIEHLARALVPMLEEAGRAGR